MSSSSSEPEVEYRLDSLAGATHRETVAETSAVDETPDGGVDGPDDPYVGASNRAFGRSWLSESIPSSPLLATK